MVYCHKCGILNNDGDAYCKSCGAGLNDANGRHVAYKWQSSKWDYSGAVWGFAFGVFFLLLGLAIATGIDVWRSFWAIILIGIGAAILVGAVIGLRRGSR